MKIVPATPEIIEAYFGHPQSRSMKAFAAIVDGRPICIGGVKVEQGRQVAFANISKEMRKYPVAGMKMARKVLEMMDGPVYAMCDRNIEAAERFLDHLGFKHLEGDVWQR